ncbi:MAG: hypothetical protein LDL31_02520 [Prosthecobacter sp.]|nr:hypothetical protein [Prosthecobacter sp.]
MTIIGGKQWQAGLRPSVETSSTADAELMEGAEDYFQELAADQAEPEKLYLRAWARLTLERSLDKLREEQADETARQRFDQLAPHLVQEGDGEKLTEVATRLGISETACRQALFRLRKQYRDKIREELALTLGTQDPDEIQQELQVLFQAFEG